MNKITFFIFKFNWKYMRKIKKLKPKVCLKTSGFKWINGLQISIFLISNHFSLIIFSFQWKKINFWKFVYFSWFSTSSITNKHPWLYINDLLDNLTCKFKSRGLFYCRKKDRCYRMWKIFDCSRLVWWDVVRTIQFCSIKSQPSSRIDEEHI